MLGFFLINEYAFKLAKILTKKSIVLNIGEFVMAFEISEYI